MNVSQAMHGAVHWVAPGTALRDIAKLMRDEGIGSVPVGENDRLVGMVTDRDIVIRGFTQRAEDLCARDVMTGPIVYCTSDQSIEEAARIMQIKGIRRLPVIDGAKRMIGMLSLGDLSHCGHRDVAAEAMAATNAHHPDQVVTMQA